MSRLTGFVRRLHDNTTLLQKVLLANAIILVVGAVAGTWLTMELEARPTHHFGVHVLFVLVGIGVSLLVNYVLLKLAFGPLYELHNTIEVVRSGDFQARAPTVTGDPDISRLAQTFNLMLDRLAEHRRQVSSQILNALEEERKRISRELHDESGQSLTTMVILVEQLIARLPKEDASAETVEDTCERLGTIRELAVHTLDEIHRLMHDLRPAILDDLGLIPALRWYVNEKLRPLGFDVSVDLPEHMDRLSENVETTVFRIVQESITNIIKHADATRIGLKVTGDVDHITAVVTDNGRGFDVERALDAKPETRGLGLFGMRERANLVDGHVDIASAPGAGTRVSVRIPLVRRRRIP